MLGEVRRIAHDLRPAILDDLGLAAALDHLAREATRHGAAPVHFAADGDSTGLPGAVNTALFRIAQEALANSERHAGARRIDLTLARCKGGKGGNDSNDSNDSMVLTIADDGKGFDPASVASHPQRRLGLRGMTERIEAIGGQLRIDSSAAGTSVQASVAIRS